MGHSKSGGVWLRRKKHDIHSRQARESGWRSRAVAKLRQIDRKHHLVHPAMAVLDLGAAPGSWSQYVARRVGRKGCVVAVDLLPIEDLPGVRAVCGDLSDKRLMRSVLALFPRQRPDLILSDASPQFSGQPSVDIPRALELLRCALDTALACLPPERYCLVKTFQGGGLNELLKEAGRGFARLRLLKPEASSSSSREVYVLAKTAKSSK